MDILFSQGQAQSLWTKAFNSVLSTESLPSKMNRFSLSLFNMNISSGLRVPIDKLQEFKLQHPGMTYLCTAEEFHCDKLKFSTCYYLMVVGRNVNPEFFQIIQKSDRDLLIPCQEKITIAEGLRGQLVLSIGNKKFSSGRPVDPRSVVANDLDNQQEQGG